MSTTLPTILLIAAVVLLAAAVVILFGRMMAGRRRGDSLLRRLQETQEKLNEQTARQLQQRLDDRLANLTVLQQQMMADQKETARRQAEEARTIAALQFENLASQALRKQNDDLREANTRQINELLTPLRTKLEEFSRSVTECYVRENATRQSLSDQLTRLMDLNRTIGEEARALTSALKGDSKVQGDWGEMVLETLLESAGLVKDINFFVQVTKDDTGRVLTDDEGNRQRPDVVVLLPDDHKLVIDSKVSLTAYAQYCDAKDDAAREAAGKRLVRSVKNHIDELSAKRYQERIPNAAEHVLMFMPVEGAYFTAMHLDPELWKYAYDRRVVIVSPTHIFSVMQILAQLWRQDKQNRNAEEIARLGGLLYDRIAGFVAEFENIDKALNQARKAYDKSLRGMTSGSTSIIRTAERLRDLGARTKKRISSKTLAEMALDSLPDNPPSEQPPEEAAEETTENDDPSRIPATQERVDATYPKPRAYGLPPEEDPLSATAAKLSKKPPFGIHFDP